MHLPSQLNLLIGFGWSRGAGTTTVGDVGGGGVARGAGHVFMALALSLGYAISMLWWVATGSAQLYDLTCPQEPNSSEAALDVVSWSVWPKQQSCASCSTTVWTCCRAFFCFRLLSKLTAFGVTWYVSWSNISTRRTCSSSTWIGLVDTVLTSLR